MTTHPHTAKARKDAIIPVHICQAEGCYVALPDDPGQIERHARWHEMRAAAEHVKEQA